MTFAHAMPFGAQTEPDHVRFRLWAPAQNALQLVIATPDGESVLPMARTDEGWFECRTDAARAGTRYRYLLQDGLQVPDPASRYQPDDVHAASCVIDPRAYAWAHPAWRGRPWRETVLYELHLGAFAGDFNGAQHHLDHLANLGVTALELMPLADFEGRRNWGYDGVLPFAPDASYGDPAALKRLIDAAHARGLMMFLDVVYNHFGPSGNYLGRYAPDFFTERAHTPWGAAIDFTRRPVRDFFIHNALYWLEEYRFDGLRLDAVDQIRDPSEPDFLTELAATVRDGFPGRHVHLVLENDNNAAHYLMRESDRAQARSYESRHLTTPALRRGLPAGDQTSPARDREHVRSCETPDSTTPALRRSLPAGDQTSPARHRARARCYTAQWNDDFHHAAHVVATGEHEGYYADYSKNPVANLARALAEGFVYQGEHSRYRDRARGEASTALPPTAFIDFLQNHDQIGNRAFGQRLASLAEPHATETLTAIWLLAPAIPLLFMGQEWGTSKPFCFFCDFEGALADAVREGRRREFAKFAAFSDPAARARIPDPNAEATFLASRLDWDECAEPAARERLDRVRALLTIRRREIMPRLGDGLAAGTYRLVDAHAFQVTWTLADRTRLHLMANPDPEPVSDSALRPPGRTLFAYPNLPGAGELATLPPRGVIWTLEDPAPNP